MSPDKKDELIDIAGEYFLTKSFAKTSIQNIIDKAKIAKGTFYHYFKSKDDILDALVKRYVKGFYKKTNKILDLDMSAIEKLNYYFSQAQGFKANNIKLLKIVTPIALSENNIVLRTRMLKHTVNGITPVFNEILKQGVEEGVFKIDNIELTSRYLLSSFATNGELLAEYFLADKFTQEIMDALKEQVLFFEDMMARVLGAPKGSLKIISDEDLEKIMKGLLEA